MSRLWNSLKSKLRGTSGPEIVTKQQPLAESNPAVLTANQSPADSDNVVSGTIALALDLTKLKTVSPHIPMIKFRKNRAAEHAEAASMAGMAVAQAAGIGHDAVLHAGALEWWELPAKYRRQEIDEYECDVINAGGPDKPWQ